MRTPVNDFHDEIRALAETPGRGPAPLALRRRLPGLPLADADAHLAALRAGRAPGARLRAVAAKALRPPAPCVPAIRRSGDPAIRRSGQ
ncbi:hypothetical protein [Streptomyces sp. NPDC058374]|uniref:hypothetical protein n=1 Tax=Streptomyces sp. NPDC058374 TaxID=3346466 RepID=UPI00366345C6